MASVMTKAGYCFRCDAPADGEVCPRCGATLYREKEKPERRLLRPTTVGETQPDQSTGLGPRAIAAIVVVGLLLLAIAVVAASASGVS